MQPTDQDAEAAQTRPETTVERLATLFQRVRTGDLTPYDAAERALALMQQAPLPPPPRPHNTPEQEQGSGVSTTLPLPPAPSVLTPAGVVGIGDTVTVLCEKEDKLTVAKVTAIMDNKIMAGRNVATGYLTTFFVREVIEVLR
jgi:hypothetical protein